MKNIYVNYLMHYGIKGQKWGVKNGPPYPLGQKDLSASEKKERNASRSGNSISNGKVKNSSRNPQLQRRLSGFNGDLDPEAVKALTTLSIATAMTAYVAVAPFVNVAIDNKKNKKENGPFSSIKKISKSHTKEQDMRAINPDFKKDFKATMNCTMCSTAYELRRRGYDVQAAYTALGRSNRNQAKWFNLSPKDINSSKSYNKLIKELDKMPNNSRGFINCEVGPYHSRHSMVWERENGKTIIRDCQSNKTYKNLDESIICKTSFSTYDFARTDNATINEEKIMEAVMPRRGK